MNLKLRYRLSNGWREAFKNREAFKIENLQQIYLGEVQSEPLVLGYIEGAPPIPSENLTRPFYEDPTKPSYLADYDSSSVKLTKDENINISYSATREDGR